MPHRKQRILRKTKVVATLGPACDEISILTAMVEAGMDVARLNLSHGTHADHQKRIELVRKVVKKTGRNIAIMLDTKGLEIRTGYLNQGQAILVQGQDFILHRDTKKLGDEHGVAISYPGLVDEIKPKAQIFLDDGLIELVVKKIDRKNGHIYTTVVREGILKNRKGLNLPDTELSLDPIDEENRLDLKFAVDSGCDYIAASFVRDQKDVLAIRKVIENYGGQLPIIAKIENRRGVDNLENIIATADGTMVARGDLGVELAVQEIPIMQKRIIRTTVMNGKPVITATQMLDSMERNPRPTRAEATDVANAIFDGTSAVMLSGETAAGKYPVEAVQTMVKLAQEAERSLAEYGYLQKIVAKPINAVTDAVSQAAITMATHLNAAAILTLTESGFTSRAISKYRPPCPIVAITRSEHVRRKLALNWGVTAFTYHDQGSDQEVLDFIIKHGLEQGYFKPGDHLVATAGISYRPGSTNLIRVITV